MLGRKTERNMGLDKMHGDELYNFHCLLITGWVRKSLTIFTMLLKI
jgi:hypothetical protein